MAQAFKAVSRVNVVEEYMCTRHDHLLCMRSAIGIPEWPPILNNQ